MLPGLNATNVWKDFCLIEFSILTWLKFMEFTSKGNSNAWNVPNLSTLKTNSDAMKTNTRTNKKILTCFVTNVIWFVPTDQLYITIYKSITIHCINVQNVQRVSSQNLAWITTWKFTTMRKITFVQIVVRVLSAPISWFITREVPTPWKNHLYVNNVGKDL